MRVFKRPPTATTVRRAEEILEKQGFDEIISITDEDVTLPRLLNPAQHFQEVIRPNDRFLFYYSGHGVAPLMPDGERQGYLPLVNAKRNQYDPENAIAMDNVVRWLGELESNHLLVILDCCFSGNAIEGIVEVQGDEPDYDPRPTSPFLQEMASLPARYLLMAGGENQESIGGRRWNGSLFTDAFIKGLEGKADRYNDKIITLNELVVWLKPAVFNEANRYNKTLTPILKDLTAPDKAVGDFFFVR